MSRRLRDEAWARIREGLDVSASAKVLLLAIAEHCNGELRAFEETIAEWVGLSPRSVRRYRAELVEAGCLVQTSRSAPGHAPRFDVLPEENTGQPMADEHRPTLADVEAGILNDTGHDLTNTGQLLREHRPSLGHQNQKEPEEPAREDDESEFEKWAQRRAEAKGGGPGLVKTMLAEDRHIFDRERAADRQKAAESERRAACRRCDGTGTYWRRVDGTITTADDPEGNRAVICHHEESTPQPTPERVTWDQAVETVLAVFPNVIEEEA